MYTFITMIQKILIQTFCSIIVLAETQEMFHMKEHTDVEETNISYVMLSSVYI